MENKQYTAQVKAATAQAPSEAVAKTPFQELKTALLHGSVNEAFARVMGDKADRFIQTIISVVSDPANVALRTCDRNSIIHSAMVAAYTGLSLDRNLGQTALIPYGNRCTFQIMANGLIQLALKSGGVKRLNVSKVYEGDIESFNPFTNEYTYNQTPHDRTILIGYIGYIELIQGYSAYLYMTIDEIKAHGMRYSKSYRSGLWTSDFEAMARKTICKALIKKHAIIDPYAAEYSAKLSAAMKYDGGTPDAIDVDSQDVTVEYPDGQTRDEYVDVKIKNAEK